MMSMKRWILDQYSKIPYIKAKKHHLKKTETAKIYRELFEWGDIFSLFSLSSHILLGFVSDRKKSFFPKLKIAGRLLFI